MGLLEQEEESLASTVPLETKDLNGDLVFFGAGSLRLFLDVLPACFEDLPFLEEACPKVNGVLDLSGNRCTAAVSCPGSEGSCKEHSMANSLGFLSLFFLLLDIRDKWKKDFWETSDSPSNRHTFSAYHLPVQLPGKRGNI